ncbi:MAG: PEP-CTERM sorting domain-containing protein [Gammaproteobacteria bacterium]|nr:PEP-CTERM sorting domain-containing protein [Gammaproteobacteria bacterium]
MQSKRIKPGLVSALFAAVLLSGAQAASAGVVIYTLADIGTFAAYTEDNVGQTFAGTGFVGMYETVRNGSDQFAHLFGLEDVDYSRTVAQVGIGGLAGAGIVSATLSFDLLDGSATDHGIAVTGFAGTGALGWIWDAPGSNYGSVGALVSDGANSVDVTALLAASVLAGDAWFNLHLRGTDGQYVWTYSDGDPDNANVRLTVVTRDAPEPATLALFGAGLLGFAGRRRRAC